MPIAYVLDEHLRGKPIRHAIRHHNLGGGLLIDATRVGDPADLPLGSSDAAILEWAQRAGPIILTEDARTFPAGLALHLHSGQSSPGVFVILTSATVALILRWLEFVVTDNQPDAWRDRVTYVP